MATTQNTFQQGNCRDTRGVCLVNKADRIWNVWVTCLSILNTQRETTSQIWKTLWFHPITFTIKTHNKSNKMQEEALEKHITPSVKRITFSTDVQWCFEPSDNDYCKSAIIQQNSLWTETIYVLWALKYHLF